MIAGSVARTLAGAALLLAIAVGAPAQRGARNLDLVIANRRVLDPESRLYGVRHNRLTGRTRLFRRGHPVRSLDLRSDPPDARNGRSHAQP